MYEKAKLKQKEGRVFPERYHQNGVPLAKEYIQKYLDTLDNSGKTKRTQQEERRYGKWWQTRLAGKRLSHITPADLDRVKRELIGKDYAQETIKHDLKLLRHILNIAVRDGNLDKNPFTRFTMPKTPQRSTRFLTMDEEAALLRKLGAPYSQWARLAILIGLRKTELFSLRWANVDFNQGIATLPHTKSGKVQYALLNDEAKELLRGFPSWKYSAWVFPSKTLGTHLDSYNFYGRIYQPAVKAENWRESPGTPCGTHSRQGWR